MYIGCLRPRHNIDDCRHFRRNKCRMGCPSEHHPSICNKREEAGAAKPNSSKTELKKAAAANITCVEVAEDVLLNTATVYVKAADDSFIRAIALFDDGAMASFITQELAEKLEIPVRSKKMMEVSHFGTLKNTGRMQTNEREVSEGHVSSSRRGDVTGA